MKTILVPVDFSSVTDSVVNEAVALARSFEARVVLLAVVQPPVVLNEYASLINLGDVIAAGEKHAARQLRKLEKNLQSQFIKTECVQEIGSPVTHIVNQSGVVSADYIVMGSHGHTAFYDLLVGSTTHGVLMRAKCPVMVVPPARNKPKSRAGANRPA